MKIIFNSEDEKQRVSSVFDECFSCYREYTADEDEGVAEYEALDLLDAAIETGDVSTVHPVFAPILDSLIKGAGMTVIYYKTENGYSISECNLNKGVKIGSISCNRCNRQVRHDARDFVICAGDAVVVKHDGEGFSGVPPEKLF